MGRPTNYNQRIADAICARIARGESLRSIGRRKGYPLPGVVTRWLAKHGEFSEQYAKARTAAADYYFEEMVGHR